MLNRIAPLAALLVAALPGTPAAAESHFADCTAQTGSNATVIIPAAVTDDLEQGDEIAAFTPEGACAGVAVWDGESLALALWEDDPTTPEKEGFAEGEAIAFRVWRAGPQVELPAVEVELDPDFTATAHFERDGIFLVASMSGLTTAIEDGSLPEAFELEQNFPNPFASTTTIRYGLPEQAPVRIELYNVVGQRVALLFNETQQAGWHRITLDASNLASGTYIYRITAGSATATRRMVLLR